MSLQDLQQTFFQDPRWAEVEEMLLRHVEPLIDVNSIDLKQPAEHVKAEIIGRTIAYNAIRDFLQSTKVLTRPIKQVKDPWA